MRRVGRRVRWVSRYSGSLTCFRLLCCTLWLQVCVRAGSTKHIGFATTTMEIFSPCTPPPKSSESEPSSPKQTPEGKIVDEKRWIRAHARDMEIQYRTWLATLKGKEDRKESMRDMTTHELAALDHCVAASDLTPVFHHEPGSAEIMICQEISSCHASRTN